MAEDDYSFLKMGKKSKDKPDIYYRKAKEDGWRARSAYKLLQINERYNILDGVGRAVDLCAAPGSWSQVLSRKLYLGEDVYQNISLPLKWPGDDGGTDLDREPVLNSNAKIVAVDLQPMAPLPGVTQLLGDITRYETAKEIMDLFDGGKADLVICDGAPDVTGMHDMDVYLQSHIILSAVYITCNVLKETGNFVAKIFQGRQNNLLVAQFQMLFKQVFIYKPNSSRETSTEAFIICKNYAPPEGFDPTLMTPYLGLGSLRDFNTLTGVNRKIIPFIVCGDISGYEPDELVQARRDAPGIVYEIPKFIQMERIMNAGIAEGVGNLNLNDQEPINENSDEFREAFIADCKNSRKQKRATGPILLDTFTMTTDVGDGVLEAAIMEDALKPKEIEDTELVNKIYAHKMKLTELRAQSEGNANIKGKFGDYVFKDTFFKPPIFETTSKGKEFSVTDFLNFDKDNTEADNFFKDIKDTFDQAVKDGTASRKGMKKFSLPCDCGKCGK